MVFWSGGGDMECDIAPPTGLKHEMLFTAGVARGVADIPNWLRQEGAGCYNCLRAARIVKQNQVDERANGRPFRPQD